MRFLLPALILSVACNNNQPPPAPPTPGEHEMVGDVILKANGHEVTDKMMEAVTRNTPKAALAERKASGIYAKLVEQVGLGEVLYHAALEEKVHEDPMVQLSLAMSAREVLAQEYFSKKIDEQVTEGAIQQHYDDRAVQYKRPQARAAHILVKDKTKAEELMKQLESGADFAALAKEHSEDEVTGKKGGELGWFQRDKLIAEVARVAFEEQLGQPHGPVETRFGFHIILPEERRDAIPLADVEDEIRNKLRNDAAEKVMGEIKSKLSYERFGEVQEMWEKLEKNEPPTPMKGSMPAGAMPPHAPGGAPHGAPAGGAPHGAPPHGAGGPH